MKDPVTERHPRRRRTWYRRRLRKQRILLVGVVLVLAVGIWQNLARQLSLPRFHVAQFLPESWARGDVHRNLSAAAIRTAVARHWRHQLAYPYSIVPGGVHDVHELREAVARDYVVRRHYARFNFERATLQRAGARRLVYMSYRRGDHVFWTRKKIHLNADELLLTDGVITARTRCGNQISETPNPEVADEEPSEDVFDLPAAEAMPDTRALPFRSSLTKPRLPQVNPEAPPQLFASNFFFPFVSVSAFGGGGKKHTCETAAQERREDAMGIVDDEQAEVPCHKRKRGLAPEPSSVLLIASGLGIVVWRFRRRAGALSA